MDFPIKSYLARKIPHFEKIKKKFIDPSLIAGTYRISLIKLKVKNIHATSLSQNGFICPMQMQTRQIISNYWNIFHQKLFFFSFELASLDS